MKKYLFVFVMALVSVTMINAQEDLTPSEGDFSIEVGFTPFNDNNAIISLPDGSIKGIYYVSDKVAIRLGLGFSTTSSNYNDHEEDWFKTNASQSQFSIAPGISYSFIGTERFAPYIGAELLFATSGNESQSDYKGGNQYIEKNHGAFNAYGVGLFTGFNYYFAKKLYVGVEAGIGFASISPKAYSSEVTTGGTTIKNEDKSKTTTNNFGVYAEPAIRLGWTF